MDSALDFRSAGRWFKARSRPSCCFLRHSQQTLPHIVSLHPGVQKGYRRQNVGGNPAMGQHPIHGGVEISLIASCIETGLRSGRVGTLWHACNFIM